MAKRVSEKPISDREEIIRHFDIVAEDLKSTMTQIIESIKDDVFKIRARLGSFQENIEKKPSHEDLSALDKRVWRLERKLQGA